jgi:excisionase family DNA binding protein
MLPRESVSSRSRSSKHHGMGASVEPLITTRQLATLWCQSPRWVLRMVKEHSLPHYVLGGTLRYRTSEVEAWLQQHHAGLAIDAAESPPNSIPNVADLRPVTDARGVA